MEIIAGDIGGTKSWLAWVAGADYASHRLRFERRYASADFPDGESLLRQFMHDAGVAAPPDCLTLALPGAVDSGRAPLTNLDWTLDAAALQAALGIAEVRFMNDFQAAAAGVATLTGQDCLVLNPQPVEAGGVRAITGAGTGLGLAWMQADALGQYRTFATEGGHVDFAPANTRQARLLEFTRGELGDAGKSGHVSWERLVSGLGINGIYRFCLREMMGNVAQGASRSPCGITPDILADGARVSALAAQGDPVACAALDLFTEMYGAWVGNVALLYQPRGGLYIAGGVAIHLRDRMQSPRFMAACEDKGRMRAVVERTPIFLIINQRLGVQGAIQTAFDRKRARSGI
jgi:glucokinase